MESLGIGRVFSRMGSLIGASLGSVGVFFVALLLARLAINYALHGSLRAEMAGPAADLHYLGSPAYWVGLLLSLAFGSVTFAGAVSGMVRLGKGEAVSVGDCFRWGLAYALPTFALMLLWWLGVALASLLLVVPGLILMTMWSASMPALLAENTGVIGAFGRSRALTKGSRWRIFVVLLVVMVLFYVTLFGSLGLFGFSLMRAGPGTISGNPLFMGAAGLVGGLFSYLVYALISAIYLELVELRGGADLGAVFA